MDEVQKIHPVRHSGHEKGTHAEGRDYGEIKGVQFGRYRETGAEEDGSITESFSLNTGMVTITEGVKMMDFHHFDSRLTPIEPEDGGDITRFRTWWGSVVSLCSRCSDIFCSLPSQQRGRMGGGKHERWASSETSQEQQHKSKGRRSSSF